MCVSKCVYECLCLCLCVCICVCVFVNMNVCVCVCLCMNVCKILNEKATFIRFVLKVRPEEILIRMLAEGYTAASLPTLFFLSFFLYLICFEQLA